MPQYEIQYESGSVYHSIGEFTIGPGVSGEYVTQVSGKFTNQGKTLTGKVQYNGEKEMSYSATASPQGGNQYNVSITNPESRQTMHEFWTLDTNNNTVVSFDLTKDSTDMSLHGGIKLATADGTVINGYTAKGKYISSPS
ncbi:MAG: hypothetical protein AAF570_03895 [Bacteroidota bacterium]